MTPLRQLVTWVITQGGRVHRDDYHAHGIALGCLPPAQNAAFGTQQRLLVRDGDDPRRHRPRALSRRDLLIRCCRGSRAAPAASPVMFIV